ncbi:sialidase family protein [Streptomyces tremellae]|uniref:exo-alpha-sialidase n=1 Tax=Streptomyces tremellae TaxID=1124239 RepID=A0ABP7E067_9ACTN
MKRQLRRRAALSHSLALLMPLVAGGLAPLAAAPAARAADGSCGPSVPYRSGTSGYHTFRIPAAVAAPGGTLLAFAEGRRDSAADDGDIDIVLRRSTDGGCTWAPLQVVADAGGGTAGNPAPVVDPATGDVVLLSCGTVGGATEQEIVDGAVSPAARRVYVQRSTDDGATWSPRRDITADVKRPGWNWYATGPGHAVALRGGPRPGRLLVPANHSLASGGSSGGHALYSDDSGATWHIGYVADEPGTVNESTLTELADGTVYVNARDMGGGATARDSAYSTDGGRSLAAPFTAQPDLAGPQVQGSVLRADDGRLLFSGPADPASRRRMQVRTSPDGGRTWRPLWTVSEDPAGYSDLVQLTPSEVGLLYETGTADSRETITYRPLPA